MQNKAIKLLVAAVAACGLLFVVSCATTSSSKTAGVLYHCGCGADCKCTVASLEPGKCKCGHDLKEGHLLKVEAGTALVCSCGASCKCTFNPSDPTKCGCGKPIQKVSLKGTGLYFCGCGGSCCTMVSAKPGQCKCGKPLAKLD